MLVNFVENRLFEVLEKNIKKVKQFIIKIAKFWLFTIKFDKLITKIAKLCVSITIIRQIDYSIIIVLLRICLNYRKFKLLEIMAFYDKL